MTFSIKLSVPLTRVALKTKRLELATAPASPKRRYFTMIRHFELVGEFSYGTVDLQRRAVLEDRRDELQFEHYADDWDEDGGTRDE